MFYCAVGCKQHTAAGRKKARAPHSIQICGHSAGRIWSVGRTFDTTALKHDWSYVTNFEPYGQYCQANTSYSPQIYGNFVNQRLQLVCKVC